MPTRSPDYRRFLPPAWVITFPNQTDSLLERSAGGLLPTLAPKLLGIPYPQPRRPALRVGQDFIVGTGVIAASIVGSSDHLNLLIMERLSKLHQCVRLARRERERSKRVAIRHFFWLIAPATRQSDATAGKRAWGEIQFRRSHSLTRFSPLNIPKNPNSGVERRFFELRRILPN